MRACHKAEKENYIVKKNEIYSVEYYFKGPDRIYMKGLVEQNRELEN